jgi:hypothetical protein
LKDKKKLIKSNSKKGIDFLLSKSQSMIQGQFCSTLKYDKLSKLTGCGSHIDQIVMILKEFFSRIRSKLSFDLKRMGRVNEDA